MKSEKGITLTSLIIYVIAMLMTVTIITAVTTYFYKNIDIEISSANEINEFTRIESYLSKEANVEGNRVSNINPVDLSEQQQDANGQIYFLVSNGNRKYTYVKQNKALYLDKIKIASNVEYCTFQTSVANGKQTLMINITINNQSRILRYTFK